MADLGAEVLKIEAGRYPDWWRGMNWTPEFIRDQMYEKATIFCGMNRGKQGISIDPDQARRARTGAQDRGRRRRGGGKTRLRA